MQFKKQVGSHWDPEPAGLGISFSSPHHVHGRWEARGENRPHRGKQKFPWRAWPALGNSIKREPQIKSLMSLFPTSHLFCLPAVWKSENVEAFCCSTRCVNPFVPLCLISFFSVWKAYVCNLRKRCLIMGNFPPEATTAFFTEARSGGKGRKKIMGDTKHSF